jgi:hypothetical protein
VSAIADFDAKHRLLLDAALEPGEELRGVCAANHRQSAFRGRGVAIGVTDRRLLVQPLDCRGDPAGEPDSILPEQVASAKAGGAGGGWSTLEAGIADHAAVQLRVRTTDGRKLKLMLMRGEGRVLGKLGGGEGQRRGVEALARWFEALERR